MKFSIIVPTFNAREHLGACLESLAAQTLDPGAFEVLVVDDASDDGSADLAESHVARLPALSVIRSDSNGGPGAARNRGLAIARGEWILFVDSDDHLLPTALATLADFIAAQPAQTDLVGFDWRYRVAPGAPANPKRSSGRRDSAYFAARETLLERYAQIRMDLSVIYNAYRRDLLSRAGVTFAPGLHEDVDFAFRAYAAARGVAWLDQVLYQKTDRPGSIVNRVSPSHLDGFMRAWRAIGDDIRARPDLSWLAGPYAQGTVGAVATRVREIVRQAAEPERVGALLAHLDEVVSRLFPDLREDPALARGRTLYYQIANRFLELMARPDVTPAAKAREMIAFTDALDGKSWSCRDLHHSAFLAPDEVRTCCKRFFVDGEMRGDVVLFKTGEARDQPVTPDRILKAKQDLHRAIQSGEPNPCDGCPFLEFKAWPQLDTLDIDYLSMEQHSICNMKCTYCSETYFGGAKPSYDVGKTVELLIESGSLARCSVVVWGGGDPVVVKDFNPLIRRLADGIPGAQQRVLTNSLKYSPTLQDLMRSGRAHVITSIDAGTEATFRKVRKRPGLDKVCAHLKAYAEAGPVTNKYIFTEGNSTIEEVRAFVETVRKWGLLGCNYQISSDFKQENIPYETALPMALMFGLLRQAGVEAVIFDELLRIRLSEMVSAHGDAFIDEVHALAGFEFIASPRRYPSLVVWGAGQHAKCLTEETQFFRRAEISCFVDSTPSKIGGSYLGRPVFDPEVLAQSDAPVLIAAVQAYPFILSEYKRLGLDPGRLVTELVI